MSERMAVQRRRNGLEHAGRSWSLPATAWGGTDGATRVAEATRSGGRPLEAATRATMEHSFGHDFSQVRVHADGQAAAAAAAVDALAYTAGADIVFGAGQYAPETSAGRELLGHELTHVVQQAAGTAGAGDDGGPMVVEDAALERAAHEQGTRAARGEPASVSVDTGATASVQRQAIQREGDAGGDDDSPLGSILPFVGQGLDKVVEGAGGLFAGPLEAISGFSEGGILGNTKGVGGVLESIGGVTEAVKAGLGLGEGAAEGAAAGAAAEGGAGILGTAMEALGPIGAVIGAGVGGVEAGNYLANKTEVGGDTVDTVGALDKMLGGDPEHGKSAVVAMDDYRQQQWDQGGMGYLKGTGALLGEAAIGTAGAIGGLAEGAVHGVESVGKKIWDWL